MGTWEPENNIATIGNNTGKLEKQYSNPQKYWSKSSIFTPLKIDGHWNLKATFCIKGCFSLYILRKCSIMFKNRSNLKFENGDFKSTFA